jgi:hypothetical protein
VTQRDQVLAMLKRGPHTTGDFLAAYIPRFSARIDELRARGYVIERTRASASSFAYRLVSEPPRSSAAAVNPSGPVLSPQPTREQPRQTLFATAHTPLGAYDEAA